MNQSELSPYLILFTFANSPKKNHLYLAGKLLHQVILGHSLYQQKKEMGSSFTNNKEG